MKRDGGRLKKKAEFYLHLGRLDEPAGAVSASNVGQTFYTAELPLKLVSQLINKFEDISFQTFLSRSLSPGSFG